MVARLFIFWRVYGNLLTLSATPCFVYWARSLPPTSVVLHSVVSSRRCRFIDQLNHFTTTTSTRSSVRVRFVRLMFCLRLASTGRTSLHCWDQLQYTFTRAKRHRPFRGSCISPHNKTSYCFIPCVILRRALYSQECAMVQRSHFRPGSVYAEI